MSLAADAPHIVVEQKASLGEGAIWDDRAKKLYWVDIAGRKLQRFDPASGNNTDCDMKEQVSTVVPAEDGEHVIVGLENSVALVNPDTGERVQRVPLEADIPENRCNDGKCGPGGHFFIGTMSTVRRTGSASLYRISPDFTVERCFGGVTVSNGIAWSADESTVFYIDTSTLNIDRFDYDAASAAFTARSTLISVPEHYGKPDGMTIDSEGRLWVAMFHGACVTVWDSKSGEFIEKIDVPAKNVTSVAFGGDDLSTLYITTASIGMSEEDKQDYPSTGTLFALSTTTQGVPAYRFGSPQTQG